MVRIFGYYKFKGIRFKKFKGKVCVDPIKRRAHA